MSYPTSPLSPYLGALEIQFSPCNFYTFVYLYLMVLYQFELLHLDDYNLIYSQNKNRGLDKILTAFHLKTQHFPFTNITQNHYNQQYFSKLNPKQPQNSFTTKKNSFYPHLGFYPTSKSQKMKLGFCFLTLASSNLHF